MAEHGMTDENIRNVREDDEAELELAGLLAYLIRHWGVLLILMIIGLLVGGTASAVRYLIQENSASESNARVIARAQSNLMSETDYLKNGIMPNIDPYAEAYACANVMVTVQDESFSLSMSGDNTISYTNTIARQIMQEYGRYIGNISYEALAEEMKTNANYIRQTVNFSQNDTGGYFTVSVRHYNENDAGKILDYVLEGVLNQQKIFGTNIPDHALSINDRQVMTRTDTSILGDTESSGISDSSFKNSYALAAESRIGELQGYIIDRQTMIKRRYVLLGGLAGLGFGLFFYICRVLFSGILLSGDAAERYLHSMTLVSFPHSRNLRKRGWISRIADNLLGISAGISDRQIYEALAEILYTRFLNEENFRPADLTAGDRMRDIYSETGDLSAVREAVQGMEFTTRHFLVVGDSVRPGEAGTLTKYLREDDLPGMDFDFMDSFQEGYETIDKVHEADYIILCIQVGKSSHMSLRGLLQVLRMYRKEVFGIAVFY
ncbi:MAG: hypothetical protein K5891_11590, partial [Lachnospiraceae bacterium]|nr:hypothetical protein [Lachnospiraceae bacterium]